MRRQGGCFRCGCLGGILLLLLALWAALLPLHGLERLGLRRSPSERLLSGPPDREAALELRDALTMAGINTQGISIYVLPVNGTDHTMAVAVLDPSEGFRTDADAGEDVLAGYLEALTGGDVAGYYNIERVVLSIRDAYGDPSLTVTAPTEAIQKFATGGITREDFLQEAFMQADWLTLISEVLQ
jgi:hypothetical protein